MKKRIDVRLLAAAGLCMALLAVPPLAVQVQAAQYAAPQTRPALPGVMSDEIRLDPVAGALYRYGVQGGINRADSTWTENAYTTQRGKLKQAAADTGLEYRHTSGVLRVMRFAPDGNAFALTTMLEPEVYGGLDTLNGITTGPDGTVSTLGGDYVFF